MPPKKYSATTKAGQPVITVISTGCKTPPMKVKFCNLVNAYFYPNSPNIPRYSITCVIEPEHENFLRSIQVIEKVEKVDSVIKNEYLKEKGGELVLSGNFLIKFQGREKVPVYVMNEQGEPEEIELEDEFDAGEKVVVVYDILRYVKKNSLKIEHGINFRPSCVYYYPELKEEEKADGNN